MGLWGGLKLLLSFFSARCDVIISSFSRPRNLPFACEANVRRERIKRFFTESWGIDRKRVDKRSMKDF